MKHREVRVFPDRIGEPRHQVSPDQRERFLADVTRPKVMGANTQRPAPIAVDDIAVLEQRREQVVRGRTRQEQRSSNSRGGNASALAGEETEDSQGRVRGRYLRFV